RDREIAPQPHLVSADYVSLAVVGDLLDLALAEVALDLATIEPFRLPRQAHNSADLVKSGLSLRTKRREHVTQVDCVLGIPVKVGTRRKPRRGHPVDHGPIAQYGQVEAVAVESDELRAPRFCRRMRRSTPSLSSPPRGARRRRPPPSDQAPGAR